MAEKRITDKERLDWMQKQNACGGVQGSLRQQRPWMCNGDSPDFYGRGRTLREAIDAAIRAERRAGRKREGKP